MKVSLHFLAVVPTPWKSAINISEGETWWSACTEALQAEKQGVSMSAIEPYDLYLHAKRPQRRDPKRDYGVAAQFCLASPILNYPDLTPRVRSQWP